jgi:hypothetical protein
MSASEQLPARAEGPAVWRGAEQKPRDWIVPLDEDESEELIAAAERLRGHPLEALRPKDFRLERTAPKISHLGQRVERGSGFVMLRGLPAASIPEDILQILYWGIGTHLGVGVSQSTAGDRIGHVYDRGTHDRERYYTRGGPLEFHMDPVDVVGLLCLRTALSGGASRIASAGEIHNMIRAERPDLLRILHRGFHNSRRGHGQSATADRIPVFARGALGVECYYLPATIRQATEEGYSLSAEEEEAIAFVDEVASRPGVFLDMDFSVGDIQFLNNRTILHSRTDYVDDPEPERKRRLLRLWLMTPHWAPRAASMNLHDRVDRAGGGVRPRHSSPEDTP